jgi:hypothetical protein
MLSVTSDNTRMMINECGAAGVLKIGKENQCFRRKSIPTPRYPPQIPHSLIWYRSLTVAVRWSIIYHEVILDIDLHIMASFL